MMTNIVEARFVRGNTAKTDEIFQWNYGQILKFVGLSLPSSYTVHFSNQLMNGIAKPQIGDADGVSIPDEYLTTGLPVYAWVFLHTGEDDGETVYSVMIPVTQRPKPVEDAPTPVQQSVIDQAIAALNAGVAAAEDARDAIEDMGVSAGTLPAGSSATVTKSVDPQTGAVSLAFGIPKGDKGDTGSAGQTGPAGHDGSPGRDGADGQDGVSPTVTVTDITGGHRVSITDAGGTKTFDVMDGQTGATGQTGPSGADGYSPTASVSKSGSTAIISITDKTGTTTATVSDGQDGQDGQNGQDGVSPEITITDITGGHRLMITDAEHPSGQTVDVMDGAQGPSGAMVVETVTGTTPSITGVDNHRYVCGEVATLAVSTPASGCIDVMFTSGSTPTILTVTPPTGMMMWADGWDETCEANTTYEINVMDGVYGVVAKWI